MKKFSILILSFLAIAAITSCDDNDSEEFNLNTNTSGEITLAPGSGAFEVTEFNGDDLAERFSWNAISLEVPVQIDYALQMDTDMGDYSAPQILGATTDTNVGVTYETLNAAAIALGGEATLAGNYKLRVVATTADPAVNPIVSNEVNIIITPFAAYPFTDLYLVGAATEPGWSNDNNNPALFRDPANETVYYYTGYFNGDQFKLLSSPGFWQPQYGERNGAVGVNDGGGSDPNVFAAPAAGYYDFVVDIDGVTNTSEGNSSFSMTANSAAATAATYMTVGIIGDSTPAGWGASTAMIQSSFDPHQYSLRNVTLVSGEMKFRANDDWATNWGADTEFSGQGTQNGPNIPIAPGTYDIFFNDLDGRYMLIPVE
ncbi:MAG: SusF/SusE family outer membrane protein [Nonlabens sp.]|uniref:SusF/SusE family outer membrane protein n=1 Tax=Nonlabens sp. TaxID=1888209 RepID=UPI003EF0D84B